MHKVIFDPHPRSAELIFTSSVWAEVNQRYELLVPPSINDKAFYDQYIDQAHFIIGQPPLSRQQIEKATRLRAIFNVESNFLDNMDYDICFERGIHVLATSPVFAMPVAEMGLGLALALLRDIPAADQSFRSAAEVYGLDGNANARLLSDSQVGFVGYGDLGVALHSILSGFRCDIKIHDPWLPDSLIANTGAVAASLDNVLSNSDVVFILAAATDSNQQGIGAAEFAGMRKGSAVVLLSRAGVVDFKAMVDAVKSGHIVAATDVFPEEPVPADDPVRQIPGFVLSAHRAGALDSAFKQMGDIVFEDMKLIDAGLAPRMCKRAERETVRRFRSKPVEIN